MRAAVALAHLGRHNFQIHFGNDNRVLKFVWTSDLLGRIRIRRRFRAEATCPEIEILF